LNVGGDGGGVDPLRASRSGLSTLRAKPGLGKHLGGHTLTTKCVSGDVFFFGKLLGHGNELSDHGFAIGAAHTIEL